MLHYRYYYYVRVLCLYFVVGSFHFDIIYSYNTEYDNSVYLRIYEIGNFLIILSLLMKLGGFPSNLWLFDI